MEPEVLSRIRADVLPVIPSEPRAWKPWQLPDGSPCEVSEDFNPERLPDGSWVLRDEEERIVSKMPPKGYYFDGVYHPLAEAQTVSELDCYPFYTPISKDELTTLKE